MHLNSRLSNSDNNMFDIIEIKYALLGCLAFTNKEDKLREMLLYVLLCSSIMDDKLSGKLSIFDIIDHMTGIIGQDYKNCEKHAPAEIINSLDKESRMALFKYMNSSGTFDKLSAGNLSGDLNIAQQKLEEKLTCIYGEAGDMRVFQPEVYLKLLNEYLTFRLNRISLYIAKEIYHGL